MAAACHACRQLLHCGQLHAALHIELIQGQQVVIGLQFQEGFCTQPAAARTPAAGAAKAPAAAGGGTL
jgi:hypothetical protein